jgi:hypothetical protein
MSDRESLGLLAHVVYRARSRYILGTVSMADEPMRALERACERPNGPIAVPVWAYIHGGTLLTADPAQAGAYPFTCPWDAGRSGFAYCTRADARKYFGWPPGSPITAKRRAAIVAQLVADVQAFSDYLNEGSDE